MNPINILITSAGVMSAVNIIKSMRMQNDIEFNIIANDIDSLSPGLHLANKYYISPSIKNEERYLKFLLDVVVKENISVLFPCYSKELQLISKNIQKFEDLNVKILISPVSVLKLCDNKLEMSEMVHSLNIPVPKIIRNPSEESLPIFSRLNNSSGSNGAVLIDNKNYLQYLLDINDPRIYQEFIDGVEYTVDVLCDKKSNVVVAVPRKRLLTKSGQSVKGVTVKNDKLINYVGLICQEVGLVGPCNIQFIEKESKYYFIEVNPRYAAGGLMLTSYSGVNIPILALKILMEFKINKDELLFLPDIHMSRYWQEIIIKGKNIL
tara:strand:- start:1638 stop:2603 length:966 start_codon:yes stop_codon:yes gene_type:complete